MQLSIPIDVWDPHRGGAERYLARLAVELEKRGHEVTVLCLRTTERVDSKQMPRVEMLRAPRFPRWLREARFAEASCRAHEASGRDILFAVRHALHADVYQPHGGSLRAAREAAQAALPVHVRRFRKAAAHFRPSLNTLLRLDREVFFNSPNLITISVSEKVEEDYRRTYPDVAFRFARLHNPVDPAEFHDRDRAESRARLLARFGISSRAKLAIFAAHRFRPKGLTHALAAIRGAREWHLIVLGRDDPSPFWSDAARQGISGRVHFAGTTSDARSFYAGADALLLPTYYDPCSLATLESLSCGTPAVTTRRNGAAELIQNGVSGFVAPEPDAVGALTGALLEIASKQEAFREGAREAVAGLGWDAHADKLEKILFEAQSSR